MQNVAAHTHWARAIEVNRPYLTTKKPLRVFSAERLLFTRDRFALLEYYCSSPPPFGVAVVSAPSLPRRCDDFLLLLEGDSPVSACFLREVDSVADSPRVPLSFISV